MGFRHDDSQQLRVEQFVDSAWNTRMLPVMPKMDKNKPKARPSQRWTASYVLRRAFNLARCCFDIGLVKKLVHGVSLAI